jgi:hypothetical protein
VATAAGLAAIISGVVTTTMYKGRLSTRPNARIVTLTNAEYERLLALESAKEREALEKRATVRFTPADMRRIMAEAGWVEVPPPAPPKPWSTLPPFLGWALLGLAVGVVLVMLYRMP